MAGGAAVRPGGCGGVGVAVIVSYAQLAEIMPHGAAARRIAAYVDPLNRGMAEFGINNPARAAAFIAQLAHESGEFRHVRELADGSAYEGRKDLGNTKAGDGKRYKGRGLIQITGRANYARVSKHFGVDFVNRPELLESPEWAARSACWYWKHGNGDLSPMADAGSFETITRRINGGLNHYGERVAYWEKARVVLSVAPQTLAATDNGLAGSRTIWGQVTTAVGTAGTTFAGEVQEVVDSTKYQVGEAAAYLPSMRTVFIVLLLLGIAATVWAKIDDRRKGRAA